MNEPTPEHFTATMTQYATEPGYQLLRREGYTVSRKECQKLRNRLIQEGVVKTRAWTEERIAKVREMVAEGATGIQIAAALNTTTSSVYDLLYKLKISTAKKKTMPSYDDLLAVWLPGTGVSTAQHFGVKEKMVTRWVRHYGLRRPPKDKKPRVRGKSKPSAFAFASAPVPPPTDAGPVAEAATYLRQQGYANVYRRSATEWQVGCRVMTEADMLERVVEMKARRLRLSA